MDERVAKLYSGRHTLPPDYIRDVLKLRDERAAFVAKISGGIHADEADLLARIVGEVDPTNSLEVGLGHGFSAMTICASGRRPMSERRHIVIDPHQTSYWRNSGIRHLKEAGFGEMVELKEEFSYQALPSLEREGFCAELAFIDGWHTFDFAFVDFFFVDKLLLENGVVVFDDADWPSIRPILRYAVTNLAYEIVATLPEKKERESLDEELGLEGSCIALKKTKTVDEREIFFHQPFY